jgi:hypothetical protein
VDIETLRREIFNGNWSNDELNSIADALKWARADLTKRTKRTLTLGDTVNFTSTKTGRNITGTVYKIAQKYVTVRTIEGLWKVPANMLEKIEEPSPMDDFNYVGSRHHY